MKKTTPNIAKEASKLLPNYGKGLSDPFRALREMKADCLGAAMVIQALGTDEELDFRILRHTVRTTNTITGDRIPYDGVHYLVLGGSWDVIHMSSGIELTNSEHYSRRLAINREAAGIIYKLIGITKDLGHDNPTTDVETRSKDRTLVQNHRLALMDNDALVNHFSSGSTMDDLKIAANEALERLAVPVV